MENANNPVVMTGNTRFEVMSKLNDTYGLLIGDWETEQQNDGTWKGWITNFSEEEFKAWSEVTNKTTLL